MSKQRMLLQEQAQKWAENSASVGVSDNEEDDDKLFDEESAQKQEKERR